MLSEEGVCLKWEPRRERGRRRGQAEEGRDLCPVSGAHKTLSAVLKTCQIMVGEARDRWGLCPEPPATKLTCNRQMSLAWVAG